MDRRSKTTMPTVSWSSVLFAKSLLPLPDLLHTWRNALEWEGPPEPKGTQTEYQDTTSQPVQLGRGISQCWMSRLRTIMKRMKIQRVMLKTKFTMGPTPNQNVLV